MNIQLLDVVVLARDLPEHGLKAGDHGAVVFVHTPDAFEVEFVLPSGYTQALLTLTSDDLRPMSPMAR